MLTSLAEDAELIRLGWAPWPDAWPTSTLTWGDGTNRFLEVWIERKGKLGCGCTYL